MAGTKEGGLKAAATNKLRHGDDFFKLIGADGGKVGRTGGFYARRDIASKAGRKGGLLSRKDTPLSEEQRQEILNRMENA